MITLDRFKESLGSKINGLSEEEVLKLRDNQDEMAEIFFSMWLKKIKMEENKIQ